MSKFSIAIHGGAGTILRSLMTKEKEERYTMGLKAALDEGYKLLEKGASSLDAVEAAVIELENNPLFNAGRGSVYTHEGTHEMDASIMRGDTLEAGAVAGVRGIQNPIVLSRLVMEKTEHVMLCGKGAEDFARSVNIPFQPDEYFHDDFRHAQWQEAMKDNGRKR